MKVFVSWSGEKSQAVAQVFHDLLPSILHAADPFISSRDIRAGTRWQPEVATELDDTDFGLICVTGENQDSGWLNFEAGALAKSVDSSRVVPIAVDLSVAEIRNPLGQFQAITLAKPDIEKMLKSMNEACPAPISDGNLRRTFEKWWPDLEGKLDEILRRDFGAKEDSPSPARTDRDILEELLNSVRGIARTASSSPSRLSGAGSSIDEISAAVGRNGVPASIADLGGEVEIQVSSASADLVRDLQLISARHGIRISLHESDAGRVTLIDE